MFGFFKKKSKVEKMRKQYDAMVAEAYRLSHTDRKASDLKTAEAEELLKEIDKLQAEGE